MGVSIIIAWFFSKGGSGMKARDYEYTWYTLKETLLTQYPYKKRYAEFSEGEFENGMCKELEQVLNYMDCLDGTHEFSNLLNDLERGGE